MMKKHKKIITIVAIIILFLLLGSFKLFHLPIPFLSKSIAKHKLEDYLGKKLDKELTYNFLGNSYFVRYNDNNITYHRDRDIISDDNLARKFDLKAREKYASFNTKQIKGVVLPETVVVSTNIDASNPKNVYQKIVVPIIIEKKTFNDDDKVKKRMIDIVQSIISYMGEDFRFTQLQAYYECNDGQYGIDIVDLKNTKRITEEAMFDNFSKKKYKKFGKKDNN